MLRAAALLLLALAHTHGEDDSFEVSDEDDAANARARGAPRRPRGQQPEQAGGIHVTYKDSDGVEHDLDDDLRAACREGDLPEISRLLGIRKELTDIESADVHPRDEYGNAPLHDAARRGQVEVAKLLLDEGGHDVNLENGMKDRPLHMSAASGQLAMTKALVRRGAQLDPQTSWGMTPLYWTANGGSRKHRSVARYLLKKGADVNATTFQNHTALHEAAREGHEEMCKLLLEAGIQADAREGLGDTALHKAAAAGQADVVRLLVEHGLDVEARNDAGETALDAAHKNGNDDVVELIMGGETTKDDLR